MNPADGHSEKPDSQRAVQLISAVFDECLSASEQAEFEAMLLADSRVCELYVRLAHLHAGVYKYASALDTIGDVDILDHNDAADQMGDVPMDETMVVPALRDAANRTDPAGVDEERFTPTPYSAPKLQKSRYRPRGLAALLAIGFGIFAYVILSPHHKPTVVLNNTSQPASDSKEAEPVPAVATIQFLSKPVWKADFDPPANGQFTSGQSLRLESGAIQLQLNIGGRLVVEGPASIQFLSNYELAMSQGKIVALVPGGGLVVRCPTGTVKDLGTEFGVDIHSGGGAEVAVFQGSVAASLASTQSTGATILTVGQAAVIAREAISRSAVGAIRQRYICNLQNADVSSLDVVDLISGGDGTTQRRGIAIDSTTGEIGNLPPRGNRTSDGKYHRIQGYPVLDGTFIPSGLAGEMKVDSGGHQFHFVTSNATHNLIETGGTIQWNDPAGISTILSGVDYSKNGHGIICTHSNNGLTMDLDGVRRLYPDRQIASFHCRVGNSYVNGWRQAQKLNPVSGVFMLVNGKTRFEKPRFTNQDGSFVIDFPISADDRFLTFVATDANTDIDQQWILWADPRLSLK